MSLVLLFCLSMNSNNRFEDLVHEARMQSIRGQYSESLESFVHVHFFDSQISICYKFVN